MYCIGIEMCKVLHIDASCISVAIFSLHMDQQIPQILWNDNEERERERVSSIVCLYMYKCSTCLPSLSGLSITILLSHMVGFFSHFKKPPKHMVILVIYNNITESFGLSNYCFICVIMRYFLVAIINTKTFL